MIPYFEGAVTIGNETSFYRVTYCGFPFPACMNLSYHSFSLDVAYAWGYLGQAAHVLAMDILRVYAGYNASWTHNRGRRLSGKNYLDMLYDIPELRSPPLPMEFIDTHCQQFADDVIANLPDNWKLTFEEIDLWVEKQEQQTKGKENARETESTQGTGTN